MQQPEMRCVFLGDASLQHLISIAIFEAQKRIKHIVEAQETQGDGPRYNYASTEDVMRDTRPIFHDVGLLVHRGGSRITPQSTPLPPSREGKPLRHWASISVDFHVELGKPIDGIIGSEGRPHRAYTVELPAIDTGGQSLDKKTLGCVTSATGYFLIGLLMLPRFEEYEISGRSESDPEAQQPIGHDEAMRILKLIEDAGLSSGDLLMSANETNKKVGGPPLPALLEEWPKRTVPRIMTWIETKKAEKAKARVNAAKP